MIPRAFITFKISPKTQNFRTRDQVSLASHVLLTISKLQLSIISLGLGDADHAAACLDWIVTCLNEAGVSHLESLLSLLYITAEAAVYKDSQQWEDTYQEKVPVCMAKFLNWLTGNVDSVESENEILIAYQQGLMRLFKTYERFEKS